ncbi:MAG: protoporphyrinogen oxidase [Chlamydiales bacterium]|nr:protoporphyrinogen oxidase [Chlamydiales bacterium]
MKRVIIIGAGISGLAAGWFHKQKGHRVTIVEKSGRAGGWIRSIRENGFLFEKGPRGFRPAGKGKRTLALVKELGLESELVAADKAARKRYVVLNGGLRPFSFPLLLRQGIIGAYLRDRWAPATEEEDETISDFCTRRFNPKITRNLVDPLVKGIFGGDIEKLSMRSCFPLVWEAEKKGPVVKNLSKEKEKPPASLYSFREGMETLTRRLAERLEEALLLNTPVLGVEKGRIILTDRTLEADQIIAAAPAYALAKEHPFTYASLTTVNMGWKGNLLPKQGYGFLIPSMEKERVLGMTWDSAIFPQQNCGDQTRICVMIEGEGDFESAEQAVKKYLGISRSPDAVDVGKAIDAIPQYLLGHHRRLDLFQKRFDAELVGNSYSGVGVNDCIEAAWKSASL